MITLYKLYDLTGYHPHSRTKWLKDKFSNTTKEAKSIQIRDYEEAYDILRFNSKNPNLENLHLYFPEQNIPAIVKSHSDQMIDIMNKDKEEEFKIITKNCSNCFYNGIDNLCDCMLECIEFNRHIPAIKKELLPMITKGDFEVIKNSFDDLIEMIHGLEQRLLILEKRTELPRRSFRNEVISKVNEIARKLNKHQHEVYKEVYQGFDVRHGITNATKNKDLKISYLEWYDKHDYLPKLLNYIKEIYKI